MKNGVNIHYKTDTIARFYSQHRTCWDEFYPSEQWIFQKIGNLNKGFGKVLDVGCAAGGLGLALSERFPVTTYLGVDINPQAIAVAQKRILEKSTAGVAFRCGDILELDSIPQGEFDHVFSLSCADWNVSTKEIISRCWSHVKQGGFFIISLRLTQESSVFDISESFQWTSFDGLPSADSEKAEKAPYVVFNVRDSLNCLINLFPRPEKIMAYGYWGKPSPSARTKYDRLCFTVFAMKKGSQETMETMAEFHLPATLFV